MKPADLDAVTTGIRHEDPERYVLDGSQPSLALSPASVGEVRACLEAANSAGRVVVPWGGGTQMGLGNLPAAVDVALDLRALNAVVEYEPNDMTIAVQAGLTLKALDRLLAEHGQVLPVDAADPEHATLGGLAAAGIAGPRRFGYMPLRDLIIGVAAVLPDGREARAGGMVVKNVSGFDLMRLYHGSLGILAVIVQLNLKVLPRPQAERTVLVRYPGLADAVRSAESIRLSQLGVTAVVLLDAGAATRVEIPTAPWTLAVRCEAPPVAVVRQAERVVQVAEAPIDATDLLPAEETPGFWSRVTGLASAAPTHDEIGARLGVRPSRMAIQGEQVASGGDVRAVMLDVGSGLVYARATGETDALRAAWQRLEMLGEHATLLTAPAGVKEGIDVFGASPAGLDVMRSLKEQFDSHHILNRGRFAGHL